MFFSTYIQAEYLYSAQTPGTPKCLLLLHYSGTHKRELPNTRMGINIWKCDVIISHAEQQVQYLPMQTAVSIGIRMDIK
jgi:hypothetical protein